MNDFNEDQPQGRRLQTFLLAAGIPFCLLVVAGFALLVHQRNEITPSEVVRTAPVKARQPQPEPEKQTRPAIRREEEELPEIPFKKRQDPAIDEPQQPAPKEPPRKETARREIVKPLPVAPPPPPADPPEEPASPEVEGFMRRLSGKPERFADSVRIQAAESLGRLGARAKPATRILCDALLDRSSKVGLAAATALREVDQTLHEQVVIVLLDESYRKRIEAVRRLAQSGPSSRPAMGVLLHFKTVILKNSTLDLRRQMPSYEANPDAGMVIEALAAIAPDDEAVRSRWATWIQNDGNPFVRGAAAYGVAQTENGRGAAATLARALEKGEPDVRVRTAIITALGMLSQEAQVAERTLMKWAAADKSGDVRAAADQALRQIRGQN